MSYESTNLRLMGGVPGQQLFLYRTEDVIADVDDSGYFDDAVDQYNLSTGDIVLAVTGFGSSNVLDGLVVTVTDTVATTALLA